jgi:hypothetical protein
MQSSEEGSDALQFIESVGALAWLGCALAECGLRHRHLLPPSRFGLRSVACADLESLAATQAGLARPVFHLSA